MRIFIRIGYDMTHAWQKLLAWRRKCSFCSRAMPVTGSWKIWGLSVTFGHIMEALSTPTGSQPSTNHTTPSPAWPVVARNTNITRTRGRKSCYFDATTCGNFAPPLTDLRVTGMPQIRRLSARLRPHNPYNSRGILPTLRINKGQYIMRYAA